MAKRLLYFMTPLGLLALLFGAALLSYGMPPGAWMHAKLTLVFCLILYHCACFYWFNTFASNNNQRSHRWFRYVNEIPVCFLLAILALVILKPF
jgi:putative membrane protein